MLETKIPPFTYNSINYKNIGVLRNLINLEGKILSIRITRSSSKKQRQTARAIKSSRILGLLPFVHKNPPFQKKFRLRNQKSRTRFSNKTRVGLNRRSTLKS